MKLVELFSGIGGFAKGLSDAGIEITDHQFSEVNKHAIANYKYNYENAKYIGAVEDVSRINGADIITFGSPCQNFSLLGNQQGLEGSKSVLIGEAIRIIDESRPRIFIWENVKGAFSTNDSTDFWAVVQRFANIGGYRLQWQLCNSNWFLPQNRERIFLVGICEAIGGECFPITGESRKDKINASIRAISYTRDAKGKLLGYNYRKHFNTIHTSTGSGGNTDQYLNSYGEIRRLGIRECEALQGFDRDWTRKGNYDGEIKIIPLTERRKLVGNAVTTNVVKAIGTKILEIWN
jgi:DNA (cytosine-5)-methyltransferase 1